MTRWFYTDTFMLAQSASTIIGNNNVRALWHMHMKWTELKQETNTECIAIAIRISKHVMHLQQQGRPDRVVMFRVW